MSNDVIFYTQVVSIVVFILALFGIYRSLVAQKDGVIELLREQLKANEKRINELQSKTPDALANALSDRVDVLIKEINRLKDDKDKHREEIENKESELHNVQKQLSDLLKLIEETDLMCPKCKAPLSRRDFIPVHGYVAGREVEADVEYIEYECGLSLKDGEEMTPCKG